MRREPFLGRLVVSNASGEEVDLGEVEIEVEAAVEIASSTDLVPFARSASFEIPISKVEVNWSKLLEVVGQVGQAFKAVVETMRPAIDAVSRLASRLALTIRRLQKDPRLRLLSRAERRTFHILGKHGRRATVRERKRRAQRERQAADRDRRSALRRLDF